MTDEETLVLKEWLSTASREDREEMFSQLSPDQLEDIEYNWRLWARESQILPSELLDVNSKKDTVYLGAGRGYGKLCAKNTIVPTPYGNKLLGDINIGDQVFDEQGKICNVTNYFESEPEKVYELIFDTGEKVITCSEHLWTTLTHKVRKNWFRSEHSKTNQNIIPKNWTTYKRPKYHGSGNLAKTQDGPTAQTITTQKLVDTFRHSSRQDFNHSIPCVFDVQYPQQSLLLDPYCLGVFLGDGSRSSGSVESEDPQIIDEFCRKENLNYICISNENKNSNNYRFYSKNIDLTKRSTSDNCYIHKLKKLNIWNNKHIPEIYLQGSVEQRTDLLKGLMDTDGYINEKNGCVEFCNTNKNIANGCFRLACSLGMKATMIEGRATLYGKDYGVKYRVCWTVRDFNPFLLERKSNIAETFLNKTTGQQNRNRQRMIVDWKEVPVPEEGMRCLEVDSPSNLFCITENFIATHNSRTISEWTRELVCGPTPLSAGNYHNILIVGETAADVRDVMVEGSSGILAVHPKAYRPEYIKNSGKLIWPSGATALCRNDTAYDGIRGINSDLAIIDELAKMRNGEETMNMIDMANRLGPKPLRLIATTPKPRSFLKKYMNSKRTILINGSTFDNIHNLPESFIQNMKDEYGGTRAGDMEIMGKFIEELEGSLWNFDMLNKARIFNDDGSRVIIENRMELEDLFGPCRIVVGLDPSGTSYGDECGILVCAKQQEGNNEYLVLDDKSLQCSPMEWARKVVTTLHKWNADKIVIEDNFGKEMIADLIREVSTDVPLKTVTSNKSKQIRAEPISALYEQTKVKHLSKNLETLEGQMLEFVMTKMKKSPDRVDALVIALTELKGRSYGSGLLSKASGFQISGFYD